MAIVFMPLISFVFKRYIDIDFRRMLQLLSFIGVALVLINRPFNGKVKFPSYLLFYLLFIIYTFYSTFEILDRTFKVDYLFSNKLVGAFNLIFIIENLKVSKKFYYQMLKYSKIILAIAFVVILVQQAYKTDFLVDPDIKDSLVGTDSNEVRLPSIYSWIGSLLVTGFAFVPIFLIMIEEMKIKKQKIFNWVLLGLLFAFLTKNRWIMLNMLLVFVLVFKEQRERFKQFLKYGVYLPIIIVIASILLSTFAGIDIKGIAEDRILESNKKPGLENKSASSRLLAFVVFGKLFKENPILGRGSIKYGMGGTGKQDYKLRKILSGRSSQIHVGYLSLLYMYGLIGGGLFLIFLYLILKKLYRDAKKMQKWAPFLGVLGFAIANLTLVTFHFYQVGLLFALFANQHYLLQHNKKVLQEKQLKEIQ